MTTALLLFTILSAAPGATAEAPAPLDPAGFVGYLEWMLDLRVTEAQLAEANAIIALAWANQNEYEMKLVSRGVELEKDLANYSQAELDGLRSSVEDEYFKTLNHRGKGQPLAAWISGLRAAARRPIARGPPPLTRQAADALAELSVSMLGDPRQVTADKAFREAFAKALTGTFPKLPADQRSAVVGAPKLWSRLRHTPPPEKDALRLRWHGELLPAADGSERPPPTDPKVLAALAPRLALLAIGAK